MYENDIQMKKITILLISITLILFNSCSSETEINTSKKEIKVEQSSSLIINLTSDATIHPHSSLMGMHLAQKALKNDINVTIFLNVNGLKLLLPGSEKITFHNENLQEVLAEIIKSGGTVIACPHCMHVHNLTKADLLDGIVYGEDNLLIEKIKEQPTTFTY